MNQCKRMVIFEGISLNQCIVGVGSSSWPFTSGGIALVGPI